MEDLRSQRIHKYLFELELVKGRGEEESHDMHEVDARCCMLSSSGKGTIVRYQDPNVVKAFW